MLYGDYLKDKSHNAIKLNDVEGVPCILTHSKGKDLKNYEIYGNSYQATRSGKNLLPYPYFNTTRTVNGITFTDNGDGSVTVNGTATANATHYFYQDTKNLINGLKTGDSITVSIVSDKTWVSSPATMNIVCNYYDLNTTMKDGNCIVNSTTKYKTTTIGDDWVGIGMYIAVYSGQTVNNITLKPQVELGNVTTEYEQYGVSPSPDYPSEVQSVGDLIESGEYAGKYAIPVISRGKNLAELPEFNYASGISVNYQDGIYHIVPNESGTANVVVMKNTLSLKAGETVTISCKINHKGNRVNCLRIYRTSGTLVYVGNTGLNSSKVPSTELTKYSYTYTAPTDITLYFQMYVHGFIDEDGDGIIERHPIDFSDFQIEYGTVATEYEPYRGIETTHIYLDEPLRKVGEYADYIDFKNQKVVRNTIKGVLNGSEAWKASGTRYYYQNTNLNIKCLGTSVAGIIGNALPSMAWNAIRNSGTGIATYSDNRIDIRADGVWKTVDKAKEYLTNNPIYYIAPRLEPLEETIKLPILKTFKGTSVISVDTSVQPSNIKAKYVRL